MESKEIWKDIPGYEKLYQVSDTGLIRSLRFGGFNKVKLLSLSKCNKGYYVVRLTKNRKATTFKLHTLISKTFISTASFKDTGLMVDHIDNDKSNNNVSNLQLVTNRYNCTKDKVGLIGVSYSKKNRNWYARIYIDRKKIFLGSFDSEVKASTVYLKALTQYKLNQYTMKKLKILEVFAGSRSWGKEAEKQGHEVFSIDIKPFPGIDLVIDVDLLTEDMLPWIPDVVIDGRPCTTYSIAAGGTHRHEHTYKPKTPFAEKCDRMNTKLNKLYIKWDCIYFIENPVGMLRKMDFMRGMNRTTVTYCSYGDVEGNHRMKPTDIWSNNIFDMFNLNGWNPRPKCFNGNTKCHHEPAPRGSKTGTQGLKNNYERSKVPQQLCEEIIKSLTS